MAQRRGTKANAPQGEPTTTATNRFANLLGFVLLAGAAVALIGLTVLLPAYAEYAEIRHEHRTVAAANADLENRLAAGNRMIRAAHTDTTFIRRLALSQGEFAPVGYQVEQGSQETPTAPPDVLHCPRAARPSPPPAWVGQAAAKLSRPETRRGMLLLAGGILLTSALMFSPATGQTRKG